MRSTVVSLLAAIFISLSVTPAKSQTRRPPPRSQYSPLAAEQAKHPGKQQPQTWYDFALSRLNPSNFDYGGWMEERRRAFLEASLKSPYFDYGLAMTITTVLLMAACSKLWIDGKRREWLTAEMMTDLLNQDQRSRQVAKEAIRKHNDHIERCNRVIEAAESGHPLPGSVTEAQELQAKVREAEANAAALTRDKKKIEAELEEKKLLIAQLSLRVEDVAKEMNRDRELSETTQMNVESTGTDPDKARLMQHINNLQLQLYTERKKNERLKGA